VTNLQEIFSVNVVMWNCDRWRNWSTLLI